MQVLAEIFWRDAAWSARKEPGADTSDTIERDEHGDEQCQAGATGDPRHRGVKRSRKADVHKSGSNEAPIAHEGFGCAAAFAELADVLDDMIKAGTLFAGNDDDRRP